MSNALGQHCRDSRVRATLQFLGSGRGQHNLGAVGLTTSAAPGVSSCPTLVRLPLVNRDGTNRGSFRLAPVVTRGPRPDSEGSKTACKRSVSHAPLCNQEYWIYRESSLESARRLPAHAELEQQC